MATVVADVQWAHPRSASFPWAEWTDGRIWQAKRSEDFIGTPGNFVRYLYVKARLTQQRVRTKREGDLVTFQFFAKEDNHS